MEKQTLKFYRGKGMGMYVTNGKIWRYRDSNDADWLAVNGFGHNPDKPLIRMQAQKLFPIGMKDFPKELTNKPKKLCQHS